MKRPTIALAMIVKNEASNIGPLLKSVKDCFDQIYITDTGSTDNTVEILKSSEAEDLAGCPIHVSHFEWVNDFAKARQYSFDQVPKEINFIMWLDCDDKLGNREAFIHFRDHTMHCADMWLATYNYAFDEQGMPSCAFLRERIIRNNMGFQWRFFLHEGILPPKDRRHKGQFIQSWTVDHQRTMQDLKKDNGRNIRIFELNKELGDFEPRMKYYYGKELFDAGRSLEAIEVLRDAIINHGKELDPHDRIMAVQYLSMSYAACEKWSESLTMAFQGMQLCPDRAEYWALAGDANLKMNRGHQSTIFYEAAKRCSSVAENGMTFTAPYARIEYPRLQLAQIYEAMQDFKSMIRQGEELIELGFKEKGEAIIQKANAALTIAKGPVEADLLQTEDILITCPPELPVTDWDENTLATVGAGGSETACIEIARLLKRKTGRPVKVFHPRKTAEIMPSGVEYYPCTKLKDYVFKYKPHVHIAWRHSVRVTPAATYLWCHDLITAGAENIQNYDTHLCLTEFHKEFVKDSQGIPDEKIKVISNGIDPELFKEKVKKNPYKIIFSSSPDRGMERVIEITKRVREEFPAVELHLFYGFDNMRKAGMGAEADRLEAMIRENSFVKYHGFVNKQTLMQHMKEAVVWLYPADFIETSCITAMEALCAGTYPIVRRMGALPYTLAAAIDAGMCTILEENASCAEEYDIWAKAVSEAIREEKYNLVQVDPNDYSWDKACDGMIKAMGL